MLSLEAMIKYHGNDLCKGHHIFFFSLPNLYFCTRSIIFMNIVLFLNSSLKNINVVFELEN